MILTGLDKEVSNRIQFFQKQHDCVIAVCENNGKYFMQVLFVMTGKIEQDIYLCEAGGTKYKMLIAMGDYFRAYKNR